MNERGYARQGVFISYARADGEASARALHARLAADAPDIAAWLDRYEIEGGVGWWNQIEQELDRAEFLLLVMTPAAMRSENTRREWRSARQRGLCVYPVKAAADAALDYDSLPNWMRKSHFYDPDAEWLKLIAHLRRGCQATRVPFMAPPLHAGFVARTRETQALLDLLLTQGQVDPLAATVALRGSGGFGKTTLAAALCHDDRVIDAFDDGILWATLGQSPNLLNELVKLYAALTGERPGFVDVEDAARELALKLEGRNCLLVIDDAWSIAHVRPFLRGGAQCARLITTRLFEVALEAQRVDVDEMTPAEGLQLLLARSGAQPSDMAPFRRLAARLGEWPLAIKLAASVMRQRVERGDTMTKALDYVVRAIDKRGITAFDKEHAGGREEAVSRTVGVSLDLLTQDEQRQCAELAIFAEDQAIPIATAGALWQLDELDSEDLVRKLDDFALIECDLQRATLHMHDVLREFLTARLGDAAAVHGRLVDAWGDAHLLPDPFAWHHYAYHMSGAGRARAMRSLLMDPVWIERKLRATGIHSLIADFEFAAPDPVLDLIRDALQLAAPVLATDADQLRSQLVGRLLARGEPEIVALRAAAGHEMHGPWLRPLQPTLDGPGGMLLMTLVGHERGVTSLAMDAQSRRLVSASHDGTLRIWDCRSGQLVHTLFNDRLGLRGVALGGDGQLALCGGADGLLYLWDIARGELSWRFSADMRRALTAVAVSADAGIAICAAREPTLRVVDVAARAVRQVLGGHLEQVTSAAISSDGSRAVSGSDDCTICVWNLRTGHLERTLEGHGGPVNAVALSADGRYALSGSGDRTVRLWDAESGACLRTMHGHQASVTAVGLASGAWRAISGSSDQEAKLWDLETGSVLAHLQGHSDAVTAVAIDDGGTRAATGSADRSIKLWRLDDLRPLLAADAHDGAIVALVFSPDGSLCASGGSDGRVQVRELASGRVVRSIDAHSAALRSLAFTADGSCVLSGGVDGKYWLWTIENGEAVWVPVRHLAPIDYCALSATTRYLTTSCSDRFVYFWEVPSGALIARYGTRRLFDHLIAPAPRRRELPQTDEYLDTYLPGESVYQVIIVRMSASGDYAILSATRDDAGSIRSTPLPTGQTAGASRHGAACLLVLDLRSGEIRSVCAAQAEAVSALAIDSAGRRLLWARSDHALELWALDGDERIATLFGHKEKVTALAFSADGRYAISCARDRCLRVWRLDTGEAIATFTADAALRSIALAADNTTLAAGDVAGRVHLLRLEGILK